MFKSIVSCLLYFMFCQPTTDVTHDQKQQFLKTLATLPHEGEFFSKEAINKAAPFMPELFSLSEKDLGERSIYPLLALSRGLCDREEQRKYATRHFFQIRHLELKLFWGIMLFNAGAATDDIVRFLKDQLRSSENANVIAAMTGPNYEDFKRRVMAHPAAQKDG